MAGCESDVPLTEPATAPRPEGPTYPSNARSSKKDVSKSDQEGIEEPVKERM